MKTPQKVRILVGVSLSLLVVAAICEWKRRILDAQSNAVLRKGYVEYTAEGQTQTQYLAHSILVNNWCIAIECAGVGLAILGLLTAAWLHFRHRSNLVRITS